MVQRYNFLGRRKKLPLSLCGHAGLCGLPRKNPGAPIKRCNPRACHLSTQHSDRAILKTPLREGLGEKASLQCIDDRAHAPRVCRARCLEPQHAPHGHGEAESLRPCLQPHPHSRRVQNRHTHRDEYGAYSTYSNVVPWRLTVRRTRAPSMSGKLGRA